MCVVARESDLSRSWLACFGVQWQQNLGVHALVGLAGEVDLSAGGKNSVFHAGDAVRLRLGLG